MSDATKARADRPVEVATLGGGCFWCLEAVFQKLRGVVSVVSGYSGGRTAAPSYEQVCSGQTGHAEVVQITFNPEVIPFRKVLEVFFATHDPTTPNRQGADIGTQYRSVIFYRSPGQKAAAEQLISELNDARIWDAPIVTELAPLEAFHPAEAYHQDYYRQNMAQPYCQAVIAPKLAKLRRGFASQLSD